MCPSPQLLSAVQNVTWIRRAAERRDPDWMSLDCQLFVERLVKRGRNNHCGLVFFCTDVRSERRRGSLHNNWVDQHGALGFLVPLPQLAVRRKHPHECGCGVRSCMLLVRPKFTIFLHEQFFSSRVKRMLRAKNSGMNWSVRRVKNTEFAYGLRNCY